VDGTYRLRHRKIEGTATLAVSGASFRAHVPPATEIVRELTSHNAAVAAMNAELLRLTKQGWNIADLDTATESAEEPDVEYDDDDDEDFDPSESVSREGDAVMVDASKQVVDVERAKVALRSTLDGARQLVISDCQEFEAPWYWTVEPWCAALGEIGSASLERLIVDTSYEPLTRQACFYGGNVSAVFRMCPNLRFAYVIGCAEFDALAHDQLEDLTLMSEPITPATITAIVGARAPRLARLALGFAYNDLATPAAEAALIAALARHDLPSLRELHIAGPANGAGLLAALSRMPSLDHLRVLSVDGNVFDDEEAGLAVLREHYPRLGRLEALYLPLEDIMGHDDAELARMFPILRGTDALDLFSPNRYRASPP
jgi:hypothetical protein